MLRGARGRHQHLRWVGCSEAAGGLDAGCLRRRRPALSGPAWFPRFGAGKKKKNVPSHGAALGGAEVSSAAAPEPVPAPGRDLWRAALAHLAVCGFLSPGAGRPWAHASPA